MKIRAAIVYKPGAPYTIEEIDLAQPQANEVLVKIVASGVCHTDHTLSNGGINDILPAVLGHEGSGIIQSVGKSVTAFAPGDRVCMSFSYCNECYSCTSGRPYECEENMRLNFGGRSYDGTTRLSLYGMELSNCFNQSSFATYAVTHQNNIVRVPDELDLRIAGPLGCGIQTGAGAVLNCLKPEPGSSIAILGCGGVGMSALMAAKICGCKRIIAIDAVSSRLELALKLGATHAINARNVNPVQAVKSITDGKGAHYAVNASGIAATAGTALACTRVFGKLAAIGGGGEATIGFYDSHTITGITQGQSVPREFVPKLIDFYQRGLFPFDELITFYDFDDINKAAADSLSGSAIKPVLLM